MNSCFAIVSLIYLFGQFFEIGYRRYCTLSYLLYVMLGLGLILVDRYLSNRLLDFTGFGWGFMSVKVANL